MCVWRQGASHVRGGGSPRPRPGSSVWKCTVVASMVCAVAEAGGVRAAAPLPPLLHFLLLYGGCYTWSYDDPSVLGITVSGAHGRGSERRGGAPGEVLVTVATVLWKRLINKHIVFYRRIINLLILHPC